MRFSETTKVFSVFLSFTCKYGVKSKKSNSFESLF